MQAFDFKNPLIQKHFVQLRESNNLIFQFASEAVEKDKSFIIDPNAKQAFGWPSYVESMFDYRTMWGVDYGRLMQLCIISYCAELEFMFKAIFTQYGFSTKGNLKGFYQRLNDVIDCLTPHVDLSSITSSIDTIKVGFQIRHICIHNMGIADQSFVTTTGLGIVGQSYTLKQEDFVNIVDAAFTLQKLLDDKLP